MMLHPDPVEDRTLLTVYRAWTSQNLQATWETFYSAREYNDRRLRAIEQVLLERGVPLKRPTP